MGKVFQTKTAQNLTQWGGTYLYGLYKGVPPRIILLRRSRTFYLRRRNSKSGIIIVFAGLKTPNDNADRLLNASLSTGHPNNVLVWRLLFYDKCTGVTVCFTYSDIYVYKSILNKRLITLPVVYRRPFASKVVFWAILKDFELNVYCSNNRRTSCPSIIRNGKRRTQTPSKSLKKLLLRQKDDDTPQVR